MVVDYIRELSFEEMEEVVRVNEVDEAHKRVIF
jgi:hypothetical protein